MDKTVGLVLALLVIVMTGMIVITLFSDSIQNAGRVTQDQQNIGCEYQENHSTDSSQISDRCLHELSGEEQDSELFSRANIPVID